MLTQSNIDTVKTTVFLNVSRYMPMMIDYKTTIQNAIRPMLSEQEKWDIQACKLNMGCVRKLSGLGRECFHSSSEKSDAVLFCICMAIGTIIKEYDWGTQYIYPEGLCQLAAMIEGSEHVSC